MPNLQEHMLRVAAVASLICDNFNESLPKEEIITACLFHDMGNIIKFKWDSPLGLLEPKLEYWKKVQSEYIERYGENVHEATLSILRELGLKPIISVIESFDSNNPYDSDNILKNNNWVVKICLYSDERVAPFGVTSIEERLIENRKRLENRGILMSEEKYIFIKNSLLELEQQIFSKCKINPSYITDETVAPTISELKNFVIK
jgi:HD superfamily phosphodiesterase